MRRAAASWSAVGVLRVLKVLPSCWGEVSRTPANPQPGLVDDDHRFNGSGVRLLISTKTPAARLFKDTANRGDKADPPKMTETNGGGLYFSFNETQNSIETSYGRQCN